jgi:hypothetical protein
MPKPAVARIWEGRTRESVASEYAAYLYEHGVKKLRATQGNLGVQVFQRTRDGIAEFMTISYYAGNEIENTHDLPKDREYLLEPPPFVKHYDVLFSECD